MSGCGNCGGCADRGSCGGCTGCGGSLELTRQEMDFLVLLGQVAFLPVARKLGDETPVYLEDGPEKQEQNAAVLQLLEKKGLIDLDYDQPLKRADPGRYAAYPIQGSIALTRRGQQVLELLEYQGYSKEDH